MGRAEKAGSGVDKIVSGWRYLGWPVPVVTEETRGQNRERLAVLRVAGTGGDRRNTSGLCGAYDACRSTPQEKPTRKTDKKSLRKEQIWEFCQEPRSASEILELLGLRNKENLMEVYLTPMLKAGMLTMTEPETPTSRNQKYKAVEHGQ